MRYRTEISRRIYCIMLNFATAYEASCGNQQFTSYSDTVLFIRHYAENRRRTCVNLRFPTLFVIRCYIIVAE